MHPGREGSCTRRWEARSALSIAKCFSCKLAKREPLGQSFDCTAFLPVSKRCRCFSDQGFQGTDCATRIAGRFGYGQGSVMSSSPLPSASSRSISLSSCLTERLILRPTVYHLARSEFRRGGLRFRLAPACPTCQKLSAPDILSPGQS